MKEEDGKENLGDDGFLMDHITQDVLLAEKKTKKKETVVTMYFVQ